MVELWRLGRNRYGRAVYDRLTAAGVTATWMSEYRADLAGRMADDAGSVTVERRGSAITAPLDAPVDELIDDEVVLVAVDDGAAMGYLFCSLDGTLYIDPLERTLSFEGAYIRRVFVDPAHRERGVAGTLVTAACRWAREQGADTATALVARDNVPSRALFESRGFEVVRDRRYMRIGPMTHRSVRHSR